MDDIVDRFTRSKMMSSIKSKNTIPEIIIRKYLFARGYRFRTNSKELPGKPDIVLKKFSTVIFINGCFWHQHDCSKAKLPRNNFVFWQDKLLKNKDRDTKIIYELLEMGWRVCVIWECSIKNKKMIDYNIKELDNFILSENLFLEI